MLACHGLQGVLRQGEGQRQKGSIATGLCAVKGDREGMSINWQPPLANGTSSTQVFPCLGKKEVMRPDPFLVASILPA